MAEGHSIENKSLEELESENTCGICQEHYSEPKILPGRAKVISHKESATEKCEVHEEPLVLFCFDCGHLICQHCTVKHHRVHNLEFTKKAAPEIKTKLLEQLKPLKDVYTNLIQLMDSVRDIKSEVDNQRQSVVNDIHTSFKELHDILDEHEKKLVKQANKCSQQKVEKLSVQEKNLSLASTEVQSVVEYTEQCVSLSTDNEVMSMHAEIGQAIEQKIQEHNEAGKRLEPVEVADMGVEVRCAEALQQLCQTQSVITKLMVDPTKCTVDLPEHAVVGKLSTATLITRLSNNKQAKKNCRISSQIESLHNGVIIDCNINEDGSGQYSIQCTPTVRGRHELTVLIDRQPVAGSPFPVYVSIHPTQLGKPVKVWGDLACPIGITSNSKGELLVTELKENIFKFSADGHREKLATVNELKNIRDIACDDEDNIYCIDENTNKIFTCDKNGGNRKMHTVELEEGASGRRAILIINNVIIISEDKQGVLKVYNRDLEYLQAIRSENMGFVTGLSYDSHQRYIYASDRSNSCVRIFNNNGNFLRSIGSDKKELKLPWGVCVSGQYVYVIDLGSHCVCVFTTDGDYVTLFGQLGSTEGDFTFPSYTHVDKDGFVFVTDMINNRVQCF